MGRRGSHGCEFGVVDCAGRGAVGTLDLLRDCEERLEG